MEENNLNSAIYHLNYLSNLISNNLIAQKKLVKSNLKQLDEFADTTLYMTSFCWILILTNSFLDEYDRYFTSSNSIMNQRITKIKHKLKPAISRIRKWKDLKNFRNNVLVHNLRIDKRNYESVFIDDMRVPSMGEIKMLDSYIDPAQISNNVVNNVTFSVELKMYGFKGGPVGNMTNVSIMLEPLGGTTSYIQMNDVGPGPNGGTLYQLDFDTSLGIAGGLRTCWIKAMADDGLVKDIPMEVVVLNRLTAIISDELAVPSLITNTKDNQVTFSLRAVSIQTDIKAVSLDLSPFSLGLAAMTNTSGATMWRYSCIVPQGISGGRYSAISAVTDNKAGIAQTSIPLVIASSPIIQISSVTPCTIGNDPDTNVSFNVRVISEYTQMQEVLLDL